MFSTKPNPYSGVGIRKMMLAWEIAWAKFGWLMLQPGETYLSYLEALLAEMEERERNTIARRIG